MMILLLGGGGLLLLCCCCCAISAAAYWYNWGGIADTMSGDGAVYSEEADVEEPAAGTSSTTTTTGGWKCPMGYTNTGNKAKGKACKHPKLGIERDMVAPGNYWLTHDIHKEAKEPASCGWTKRAGILTQGSGKGKWACNAGLWDSGVKGGPFANGGTYQTLSLNDKQCTPKKDCAQWMYSKLLADNKSPYNGVYQSKGVS